MHYSSKTTPDCKAGSVIRSLRGVVGKAASALITVKAKAAAIITATLVLSAITPAHAQSSLTAPPSGQTLSTSFTMRWTTTQGARKYWVYFGSRPGANDYWSFDAGLSTGLNVTWPTPPSQAYFRIWTQASNGAWGSRDYFYRFSVGGGNQGGNQPPVRDLAIERAQANAKAADGTVAGQCKAAVQKWYNAAFQTTGAKTPANQTARLPSNASGYTWKEGETDTGFVPITSMTPRSAATTSADHQLRMAGQIRQLGRGDCLQFGNASTSTKLHTILAKSQSGTTLDYTDSNRDGDEVASYYRSIDMTRLATVIGDRGATLYRVRSDLKK